MKKSILFCLITILFFSNFFAITYSTNPDECVDGVCFVPKNDEDGNQVYAIVSPVGYHVLGTSIFAQSIKFSAKDINNKNVTEAVFADSKVTMINVWGTFCGPCIREMPDLGELSKKYDSKEFQIIGIVIDAVNNKGAMNPKIVNSAKTIVKTTGADYLHIVPDVALLNGVLSDIYAVPTTFFVDSNGNIIGQAYTGSRNLEQWKAIVDPLLK